MIDWRRAASDLDAQGWVILPEFLDAGEADAVAGLYGDDSLFRSKVVMARHGFGRGEYKYFGYPLPPLIQALRSGLYAPLAEIANHWQARANRPERFPADHASYLAHCRKSGQTRPTPLLLRYGPGDYNCLHQDLYGEQVFPLQIAILLDEPGRDFEGGEFVMTEQRPRMQSRAMVIPLRKGDGVVFAVNNRPQSGARRDYQVKMRHGVSQVHGGSRHTMGIIFHDAA